MSSRYSTTRDLIGLTLLVVFFPPAAYLTGLALWFIFTMAKAVLS